MTRYILALSMVLISTSALAATPQYGPSLAEFGPRVEVDDPVMAPVGHDYRVVFDIGTAPDSMSRVNLSIESAARFINMHAAEGVPLEDMDVVVVLHGGAARAALDDDASVAHHGAANPNAELIRALAQVGVRIYICGQTAGFHGHEADQLSPEVQLALSAMTINTWLQNEGYAIIAY